MKQNNIKPAIIWGLGILITCIIFGLFGRTIEPKVIDKNTLYCKLNMNKNNPFIVCK